MYQVLRRCFSVAIAVVLCLRVREKNTIRHSWKAEMYIRGRKTGRRQMVAEAPRTIVKSWLSTGSVVLARVNYPIIAGK